METVIAAMLLHDIGFLSDPDPASHHERGARMSYDWTGSWSIAVRNDDRSLHNGAARAEAEGSRNLPNQP
ncbi:MAG: hypothetical protein U5L98_08375 [Halomonas sp.]|uniref:hypothetical protein n=1 Tax=Halomonas sp. TaxID=1486246 RepID=UPI002ACEF085|nr:hypothetical protein [Halomonas sp.]MDZ7852644.1 hypothetical protein [Halomonas sp.]